MNWKCSCGAVFEPDMCCVCQEQRWIEEIESLRSQTEALRTEAVWLNEEREIISSEFTAKLQAAEETIAAQAEEITNLEMEFDATCNAEELRQVRAEADSLRMQVASHLSRISELESYAHGIALTLDRVDMLEAELQGIASVSTTGWDDPSDFKAWAQSRARHALGLKQFEMEGK
jgi:predicted RNase H-like nuclease (RuvC/YqgF family)